MGALDPGHPAARRRLRAPILTRRGAPAAEVRPAPELTAGA
jgi:hypothetical protein